MRALASTTTRNHWSRSRVSTVQFLAFSFSEPPQSNPFDLRYDFLPLPVVIAFLAILFSCRRMSCPLNYHKFDQN